MENIHNATSNPMSEAAKNFNATAENNSSKFLNSTRDTQEPFTTLPKTTPILDNNRASTENNTSSINNFTSTKSTMKASNSTKLATSVPSITHQTNQSTVIDNSTIRPTENPFTLNTTEVTQTQKSTTSVYMNVTRLTTEEKESTHFNLTTSKPESERPKTPFHENITRITTQENDSSSYNLTTPKPQQQPSPESLTTTKILATSTQEIIKKNERLELKTLSCDNGMMKIILRTHNTENNLRHNTKNITLSDTSCQFSVLNRQEMVLETEYGKCGAMVHQTG